MIQTAIKRKHVNHKRQCERGRGCGKRRKHETSRKCRDRHPSGREGNPLHSHSAINFLRLYSIDHSSPRSVGSWNQHPAGTPIDDDPIYQSRRFSAGSYPKRCCRDMDGKFCNQTKRAALLYSNYLPLFSIYNILDSSC